MFAIVLAERNINGGEAIKALVFLTIAMTVILQGLTAGLVARWLKLESERVTVIVGNNAVGRSLARLLYNQGLSVSLVAHLATATPTVEHLAIQGASETQAIDVLVGNALDESLLVRAHLDRAERLVVVTMNSEVNRAIAELAIKAYKPPQVQAIINRDLPISERVIRSVVSPSDLTRWERYIKTETIRQLSLRLPQRSSTLQIANCQARLEPSDGEIAVEDMITSHAVAPDTFVNLLSAFAEHIQAEAILPMVVKRQQRFFVFAIVDEWQGGDEIFFLARPGVDLRIRYQPLPSAAEMTENTPDTATATEALTEGEAPLGSNPRGDFGHVAELLPEEAES
ncbi:MAG: TrkA family potassium uptake protein [Synechococcaceae cyanobacterium SM2_3_60]|nr:TrkA family potassium uptake protein [Synechococcaceae cyanobacterium SM2_3_60]